MDLFLHELSDINSAEKMTLKNLTLLEKETREPQLKLLIRHHIQETQGQISSLEDCFKQLGAKASSTTCYVIEGLTKEKQHFAEESPCPNWWRCSTWAPSPRQSTTR